MGFVVVNHAWASRHGSCLERVCWLYPRFTVSSLMKSAKQQCVPAATFYAPVQVNEGKIRTSSRARQRRKPEPGEILTMAVRYKNQGMRDWAAKAARRLSVPRSSVRSMVLRSEDSSPVKLEHAMPASSDCSSIPPTQEQIVRTVFFLILHVSRSRIYVDRTDI